MKSSKSKCRKYKIIIFIPHLAEGGAQKMIINLLKALDKEKFEIHLVIVNTKDEVFLSQVLITEVDLINLNKSCAKFAFFSLARLIKKINPELIVSHFNYANIIAWLALKLSGSSSRIVMTEHTTLSKSEVSKTTRFLMKRIYPYADKIVVVSKGSAKDLIKMLNLNPRKVKTIYNPIIPSEILPLSEENIDNNLFTNKSIPHITSVGRLEKPKDYPTLLKAFRIVRNQIDSHLWILGDGSLKKELTKLAEDLGITNSVDFLGFQKNPYKYMHNADLFVLSSAWEGFGIVLVEAMACGCPVVSTDCMSGPREILGEEKFGLLSPVGAPDILARKMLMILTQPELAKNLAILGQKRALDFNVDKIVKDYEHLFCHVINR